MDINQLIKSVIFAVIIAAIGFSLYKKPNYRKNVLKIVNDILLVYKNFLHWNISKIVLNTYGWLFWLIISSPLIAFAIFLLFKTTSSIWSESINALSLVIASWDFNAILKALSSFWTNWIWFLLTLLFVLLIIIVFLFIFLYSYFLLQNIYKNYLEWKRLQISKFSSISAFIFMLLSFWISIVFSENPYISIWWVVGLGILASPFFIFWMLKSENHFLSYRLIWKFIWVTSWVSLYLAIPTLLLIILLYLPRLWIFQALLDSKNIIATGLYVISFAAVFIYFIYMCIRVLFTNLTLLNDSDNMARPARSFVLESFLITKWKALKIIGLSIPFFMISIFLTEMMNFLGSIHPLLTIFTWLFDFLIISWIWFMIINSLYDIFNEWNYNLTKEKVKYDDDGLELISEINTIDPIIFTPTEAIVSKKPTPRKNKVNKIPAKSKK
ncbi:MAG: hypothetical protein ACD_3C00067G0007 [uncultured bacterium (gcode 4)]|uniref:Transmembrane protein n=1 Tax=uncultured bacterium (gcode 4) TaxID=1234023 RepID=K2FZG0_9BACT|nr:MAG: hypothetical protein ACD_3C00067G0007 [uncultured bacterium (gcode 4)]